MHSKTPFLLLLTLIPLTQFEFCPIQKIKKFEIRISKYEIKNPFCILDFGVKDAPGTIVQNKSDEGNGSMF